MPFINKIEARAYARATEILERVESAICNTFPEKVRSNISTTISSAEGQAGYSISIVVAIVEDRENCENAFNFILREIGNEGQIAIKRSIDLRLDNDCVFFLRTDKQAAFLGNVKLTDRADVISVKVYFRDYPRCKRNDTIQMIEECLQSAGEYQNEE